MNLPIEPGSPPPAAPHSNSSTDPEANLTREQATVPCNVGHTKPGCEDAGDFVEGCEDPRQSEELERQQDA